MMSREGPQLAAEPFAIENRELQAVLESDIFAASSNAAKVLRFVCERHFHRAADSITEYDVAVYALGRRPDFDPQTDSIVRVETHRLRKRLREYYENEGASHAVKIVLCRGQYAPRFVYAEEAAGGEKQSRAGACSEQPGEPSSALSAQLRAPALSQGASKLADGFDWLQAFGRRWRILVAASAILAAGLVAGSLWRVSSHGKQPAGRPSETAAAAVDEDTIRILAGVASGGYMDSSGNRWSADAYFTGGAPMPVPYYSLALSDDPAIYRHARTGDNFAYDLPLRPGCYEMRLMFAESAEVAILGAVGEAARSFHVTANGVQILPPLDGSHMRDLDIVADAGGTNTADVKVFKGISPAADGKLHLRFIGHGLGALVNAIEIVPGLQGRMRRLRWRAGQTPYTDHDGNLWLADRYFRGGRLSRFHASVSGTPDPGLYEEERFGSYTYSIPVVAGGSYTLEIHFAENYFGGWIASGSRPRIFSVYANHAPLLRDFNVFREAGSAVTAVVKTFHGIKPNSFDKIVLSFEPSTEFAIVNAISVEDEPK